MLQPLIDLAFAAMYKRGAFPEPPADLAGVELDIEYEGPLARAQRSGDLTAHQQALALVAGIGEFAPDAFDALDTDANVEYAWESSGTPMRLLRSQAGRQKIREARAQAAQQAAQVEQAQGHDGRGGHRGGSGQDHARSAGTERDGLMFDEDNIAPDPVLEQQTVRAFRIVQSCKALFLGALGQEVLKDLEVEFSERTSFNTDPVQMAFSGRAAARHPDHPPPARGPRRGDDMSDTILETHEPRDPAF